jgi:hypothetical protein
VNQAMLYPVGHEIRFDAPARSGGYELRYSERGYPFYVWKKPVPRISDQLLDCVVYIYPSVDDARAGEKWGGSGFLVGVPSEIHDDWSNVYCVTNSHVVRQLKTPVVRLNTEDGGNDTIELTPEDWTYHQDGDDLAVCPIAFKDLSNYKFRMLHPKLFVTREFMEKQSIGAGDDVYMVGRFVNHQGQQQNTPIVRFGNISMDKPQPIRNEWGLLQEGFLIETRSLSGFSGSPVFVHFTPFSTYPPHYGEREVGTWLLGVNWGHSRTFESVLQEQSNPLKHELVPVDPRWKVPSNSGQAQVVPAWKLQELLDQEELKMARRQMDQQVSRWKNESSSTFDAHPPNEYEEHPPFSRDDFLRDLKKAAKKQDRPSRPDSERH